MSFPDIEHIRELIHRRDPHLLEKLPALLDELTRLRQIIREHHTQKANHHPVVKIYVGGIIPINTPILEEEQ